jgi:hypothetical protein
LGRSRRASGIASGHLPRPAGPELTGYGKGSHLGTRGQIGIVRCTRKAWLEAMLRGTKRGQCLAFLGSKDPLVWLYFCSVGSGWALPRARRMSITFARPRARPVRAALM